MGFRVAVAARAGDRSVLIELCLVAVLAFGLGVLTFKREARHRVIELGVGFPAAFAVARNAVLAEARLVNVVLEMT